LFYLSITQDPSAGKSPMVRRNISLKVSAVHSSQKKNSCLNAFILSRHESIAAAPDPS
jgi:hypothetical protein